VATGSRPTTFPPGFLFGAATASYQIEGGAAADGRGPSIWDTFSHAPGNVANGDTGDNACRHYEMVDADLELMRELGLEAYRFSIAWPRIQPDASREPNRRGLAFYDRLVDGLLARGIRPSLTLNHWDIPQWVEDAGGWPARDTIHRFVDYATIVAGCLGDRVPMWTTHNEPWVAAWLGYGAGIFAPGIADNRVAIAAHHHLLVAHGDAVTALRDLLPSSAEIGIVLNLMHCYPASGHPADVDAARLADGHLNRSFASPLFEGGYPTDLPGFSEGWADDALVRPDDLARIAAPIDFLGINTYQPRRIAAPERLPALRSDGLFGTPGGLLAFGMPIADVERFDVPRTTMGWPIEPEGFEDLLVRAGTDWKTPIYVTENGAAFDDCASPEGAVVDERRIAYLHGHLEAMARAMARGIDVRGYFVWSLFDNFEWASGYGKRFGIVYVDYPTGRRTPKSSARWYRDVVRRHALPEAGDLEAATRTRGVER